MFVENILVRERFAFPISPPRLTGLALFLGKINILMVQKVGRKRKKQVLTLTKSQVPININLFIKRWFLYSEEKEERRKKEEKTLPRTNTLKGIV